MQAVLYSFAGYEKSAEAGQSENKGRKLGKCRKRCLGKRGWQHENPVAAKWINARMESKSGIRFVNQSGYHSRWQFEPDLAKSPMNSDWWPFNMAIKERTIRNFDGFIKCRW